MQRELHADIRSYIGGAKQMRTMHKCCFDVNQTFHLVIVLSIDLAWTIKMPSFSFLFSSPVVFFLSIHVCTMYIRFTSIVLFCFASFVILMICPIDLVVAMRCRCDLFFVVVVVFWPWENIRNAIDIKFK